MKCRWFYLAYRYFIYKLYIKLRRHDSNDISSDFSSSGGGGGLLACPSGCSQKQMSYEESSVFIMS